MTHSQFPNVSVQRGGTRFPTPGTPEWDRSQAEHHLRDANQALIHRWVGDIIQAQQAVLDAACWEALRDTYDVHVHRRSYVSREAQPHGLRFIGIELAPRTSGRTFPTIYEHSDDRRWENLEDDGWPQP